MVVGLATVRYVMALFALAKAKGEQDAVGADVARLGQMLAASPDLAQVLQNPEIAVEAKKRLMRAALPDPVSPAVRDFIEYCLDRLRSDVILEAAEEFERLDREDRGIVVASIDSAKPIDAGTRAALVAQLEETTGKSVLLKESVVPELIGGVAIQIGSRRWDGSVKRRLDDLEKYLQAGQSAT